MSRLTQYKTGACIILGCCLAMLIYTSVKRFYAPYTATAHQNMDPPLKSVNATQTATITNQIKVIYGATRTHGKWEDKFSFYGCLHNNCEVLTDESFKGIEKADVLLFTYGFVKGYPRLSSDVRTKQIWLLVHHEPPSRWAFSPDLVNGIYNGTMTYRTDSDVYFPYGRVIKRKTPNAVQKSLLEPRRKGAFAYVSNCDSTNYNRLEVMRVLKQYVQVDIYGGCTNSYPCHRGDFECESRLHSQYMFFLSFENTLCKDYITEKFWQRLGASARFLPVVLGGSELSEYIKVAPPDSFLHLYNFTSIKEMGQYMQYLMNNTAAYDRYHKWRDRYEVAIEKNNELGCKLCELANKKNHMTRQNVSDWWHQPGICKGLTINQGTYQIISA